GIAIAGASAALLRTRLPVFAGGLLLFSATLMTVAVVFRDMPPDEAAVVSGRYLFPGLVAFVAVLAAGWGHLFPGSDADFRILTRFAVPVIQGLFVALVFIPWLLK